MPQIEYLSFGAGPPSLALAILNAWGEIAPPAQEIIFADTGWEKQQTYDLLPQYEAWLAEHGIQLATVQAKEGALPDYITDKSLPIPVRTETALGHRQCTDKWKLAPIEQYLRRTYGDDVEIIHQLGMTYDEVHRLRQPRTKRHRNRWPLVEKKLRRQHCDEIIRMAGLPVPPWSACVGCPLQDNGRWRRLASEFPADFEKAADMDEYIRERAEANGKPLPYLHHTLKPLRTVYSTGQLTLDGGDDGQCESGHCFT